MQDSVFITSKLSELMEKADLNKIPYFSNQNYAVITDEEPEGGFYILKKDTRKSILQMLDERENYQIPEEAAVRARNGYARLFRDAEAYTAFSGNDSYEKMLRCFTDASFSGIVLCGLHIRIVNAAAFANPKLVEKAVFEAPLLAVEQVCFDGETADVSGSEFYGRVEGKAALSFEDEGQASGCSIDCVSAFVRQSEVLYADIRCRMMLGRLFSAETAMEEVSLCGVYQQMAGAVSGIRTYAFTNGSGAGAFLKESCLEYLSLEQITAKLETEQDKWHLQMDCSGRMYFSRQPGGCDLFSYGRERNEEYDCGLKYSGLILHWELLQKGSKMEMDVANLVFSEEGCRARNGSFAAQTAHGRIGFCSWQDGFQPENQQYRRILTPFPQKRLGDEWYGMTVEFPLFQSVGLKLLFAFDHQKLYIGGKMEENGGSSFFVILTDSPFRIQAKSIVLDVGKEQGSICYGLIFKGLKASVFGMSMPNGSCNVMFGRNAQGNNSWYAVYGNRKEE